MFSPRRDTSNRTTRGESVGRAAKGPGHVLPGVYQLGSGAGWRINRRGPTRRPVAGRPCPTREDDAVNRETGGAMRDEIQRGICDLSSKYVQAVGL